MIRPLDSTDAAPAEAFLAAHRDSSMFLRANIRRAGFAYAGAPAEAQYVGAFQGRQLLGIVAHCWNGLILLQAPVQCADLSEAVAKHSGRAVTGLCGPLDQVVQARHALHMQDAPVALDGEEWLYALNLPDLVVPEHLSSGRVTCRPPYAHERDRLCEWRLAYDIELLGAIDSSETRRRSAEFLDDQIASGNAWVAVVDDEIVSLSALNAALPDIVQLGGIYTPPERRRHGYARCAVAASLLVARDRGVSRAILFTNNPHAARSYEAVGFRRIGDYSLVLFR